jgi:hypothetical protein
MVIELQVIAGVGFRSPRPKSVGLGQNLPGPSVTMMVEPREPLAEIHFFFP